MNIMKVLWFCNMPLSDSNVSGTGTWLEALANGVQDSHAVQLGIIATGPVKQFVRRDYLQVAQWLVPGRASPGRDGLPSVSLIEAIVTAVREFSPNLIHIWGTEAFWGLLPARELLPYPALLEMQGLKSQYSRVFNGGLTPSEQRACIGFKELVKFRSIARGARQFEDWSRFEQEIIAGHRYVAIQTDWIAAHVKAVNPGSRLFHTALSLRKTFHQCNPWQFSGNAIVYYSAAYPVPYKGLHIAIRAAAVLKKKFPGLQLRIAGAFQRHGIRKDGYITWVEKQARQLGIAGDLVWLGALDASRICEELLLASAVVLPSFIENCCTAMQEAMMVGTPVVASYTGGLPSIARDEESALFFPPGDEVMCAYQLERLLTDRKLALRLSQEARAIALDRNNQQRIIRRQLDIYQEVIGANSQGRI